MDDSTKPPPPWSASPTAKARIAVQRSVTALLDELAPERVLKRVDQLLGPVEQHRTPTGCVLQAAAAAVSVSWFADAGGDAPLGELHIVVWRGYRYAPRGASKSEGRHDSRRARSASDRTSSGRLPVASDRWHSIRYHVSRGQVSRAAGRAGRRAQLTVPRLRGME